MCDLIGALGLAVSAASAAVQHKADSQAADDQNRLHEQSRLNAIASFQDKERAMNHKAIQIQEANAADKFDTTLEARAAQATNTVAAGEAGISGLTIEGLARDFMLQEYRVKDRIDHQQDWSLQEIQAEKRGQAAEMVGRINQVPQARRPNWGATGLKIAASAVDAAASHQKRSKGF